MLLIGKDDAHVCDRTHKAKKPSLHLQDHLVSCCCHFAYNARRL